MFAIETVLERVSRGESRSVVERVTGLMPARRLVVA